jgi:glycosyltransferase involved in cell wall biosynthesis
VNVPATDPEVLFLYRDAPLRREALGSPAGAPSRYSLFGLDELRAGGLDVSHTLEPRCRPTQRALTTARWLNRGLTRAGGYGGDFATVLASRGGIGRVDVVLSTVDTVGLPFVLLRRARLVPQTPFVYVSVGLLDRIACLRGERMERWYLEAFGAAGAVVAYGHGEADALRDWLSALRAPPTVELVPFGVDTAAFTPSAAPPDVDVVSIGADPQRDYTALARLARSTPSISYTAVTAPPQAATLTGIANVAVETSVPFSAIPGLLARARVVVLPVRDNLYSGATTTLLQAMAMAKPVVVTRTAAIAAGYGLVDGENVRLVAPGDDAALEASVGRLLAAPDEAAALGRRARAHVERSLGWERYVDTMRGILVRVAARGRRASL